MSKQNSLMKDISKMFCNLTSSAIGVKRDISSYTYKQMASMIDGMNLVRRDEFDALSKTVSSLQKQLGHLDPQTKNTNTKPVSDKKTSEKKKTAASSKSKAIN